MKESLLIFVNIVIQNENLFKFRLNPINFTLTGCWKSDHIRDGIIQGDLNKASRARIRSTCLRLAKCRHDTLIQSNNKQQIAIFIQLHVTIRVTSAIFFIQSRHFHFLHAILLLCNCAIV